MSSAAVTEATPRPYREFGSWLRARRLARRWTQEELAKRLRYDVTYLRKIEWGTRKATEGVRARLAEVFELPVESLPDPSGATLSAPPRLPSPATSFLGREGEIEDVTGRMLGGARLVTLVGAPGIGKTRLAIEIASRLDESLEHGARFVPLLAVRDPAEVGVAIAGAVGLRVTGPGGVETLLANHLGHQELLLVLDNFEHVGEAAPLVALLLAGAPALRVLATSREPLRLSGETQFPVPPLGPPDDREPAIRLFVERARLVKPGFVLDPRDLDAVTNICERLDGVPLAIELAAAASRLLSPSELLGELHNVLDLPTQGPREAPEHQQTLRATIDWSYQRLSPGEQALFGRLGVFEGGFTLESARAVCDVDPAAPMLVVAGVASLVSKSLLDMRPGAGGRSRAVPLEAIREYALERLHAGGEVGHLRRRHAEHFAELAETVAPQLTGKEQARWLDVLAEEHANLLAALRWAAVEEPRLALRLAGALWRFWLLRSHFAEGRQWLEAVLATAVSDDPLRIRAATGAGVLARAQGEYVRAASRFDEAAALARDLGNRDELALALLNSGIVEEHQGRYDAAESYFEQSLSLYRDDGNERGVGHALNGLGNVALDRGDLETANGLFEQALAVFRSLEDQWSIALASTNLGRVTGMDGDAPSAKAYLEEALLLFRRLGERRGVAECLEELASLAASRGEPDRAARLYAAATALRDSIRVPLPPVGEERQQGVLARIREKLGERAFDEAWTDGRGMSTDDAVTTALQRTDSPASPESPSP